MRERMPVVLAPLGVSRRCYARMHGVDEAAIRKAIRQGLVFLHDDDTVNVEASNAVWGHRHQQRAIAAEQSDAWCRGTPEGQAWAARLDAELVQAARDLKLEEFFRRTAAPDHG